jgi:hypothetical protein
MVWYASTSKLHFHVFIVDLGTFGFLGYLRSPGLLPLRPFEFTVSLAWSSATVMHCSNCRPLTAQPVPEIALFSLTPNFVFSAVDMSTLHFYPSLDHLYA